MSTKIENTNIIENKENEEMMNIEMMEKNEIETVVETKEEKDKEERKFNKSVKLKAFIDDGNDLIEADMPIHNYKKEIKELNSAVKNHHVLYGTIYGVEPSESVGLVINLKYGNVRVMIPAADFFAYTEFRDMDKSSADDVINRYRRKAVHCFGGVVSFIPLAIREDVNGIPFVVASRKQAMASLQQKFFFGNKPMVGEGNVGKASIISAGPRYITVECFGVEVVIGTGDLSAYEYIEDASQKFKIGTGLMVAVKHLKIDKDKKKVNIELSHSMVEQSGGTVEPVSERMIGGRYPAKVVAVLDKYIIVIINQMKVRGLVSIEKQHYVGSSLPVVSDDVVFLVTGVDKEKNLAIGRCIVLS